MFWDCHARRSNIVDARRVFRVRQISRADAKAMFPDADEACLDAAWATLDEDDEDPNRSDRKFYDRDGESADYDGEDDAMVTIVQCQWKEDGEFFRVSTADGSKLDIPGDEWPELEARLKEQAIEYSASPFFKKIVKQAFLGSKVLETGAAPNGTQFSFTCITGKRDRNKGYWYGVVRPMKDPQRWANKWMSQALHILNTNAKGGILAEEGAFSDIKEAERTWARSDAITWAKNGALAAGKVQPKPVPPMPQGFMQLMEFAVSSVRDTVGVSVEMIGAQEAGQAASLEYQRRQTTMTILAGLFDSLRRYRKLSGRLLLEIIKKDIPPDTLVRITDDGTPSYQPLTLEAQQISYDIVVDDAPTAPNQKEAAWATIQQMLPVIGQQLTPELWLSILKYSPLPSSVISEVQQKIEKQSATPPQDPRIAMEQAKFQGQMQLEQAKMAAQRDKEASQMQADIEVEKARMEREAIATRVNAELQISLKEMDQALEREKMMVQLQLEATKLGIETRKTEMEMQRDAVTAQAQPANEAETADTSKPDRIAEIMAAFAEASQRIADTQAQLALPRRIVRDPATNRVMGVEIVQPEMQGAMQ
jgi:hypothetical protein